MHSETIVTDAAVNQPLADELFQIKLEDDVLVATDWRYDPYIRYTYSKDQSEAERQALCDAAREVRAKTSAEMKRREEVIESRLGSAPPPLPQNEWLNSDPLTWDKLRGKVVVLHFWDVDCAPCQIELPFLARWHEDAKDSDVVVIGVHPPTDDLAAVRAKLAQFGCLYPVVIDDPPAADGKLGLLHDWFGNSWWPHTVLVNKRGLIAGHGQVWMGNAAEQMRRLAAESSDDAYRD
jgi:thiol-disulfide isomerase/thioredoxin